MTTKLPVELSRHEFERLYAFVYDTTAAVNKLGAGEQQFQNRLHEIQDTLDTLSGRLDRLETNQGRQNKKLEEILDLLQPAGAA
jgi:septal ring factor EnvC (AmiA/AmiB activator)